MTKAFKVLLVFMSLGLVVPSSFAPKADYIVNEFGQKIESSLSRRLMRWLSNPKHLLITGATIVGVPLAIAASIFLGKKLLKKDAPSGVPDNNGTSVLPETTQEGVSDEGETQKSDPAAKKTNAALPALTNNATPAGMLSSSPRAAGDIDKAPGGAATEQVKGNPEGERPRIEDDVVKEPVAEEPVNTVTEEQLAQGLQAIAEKPDTPPLERLGEMLKLQLPPSLKQADKFAEQFLPAVTQQIDSIFTADNPLDERLEQLMAVDHLVWKDWRGLPRAAMYGHLRTCQDALKQQLLDQEAKLQDVSTAQDADGQAQVFMGNIQKLDQLRKKYSEKSPQIAEYLASKISNEYGHLFATHGADVSLDDYAQKLNIFSRLPEPSDELTKDCLLAVFNGRNVGCENKHAEFALQTAIALQRILQFKAPVDQRVKVLSEFQMPSWLLGKKMNMFKWLVGLTTRRVCQPQHGTKQEAVAEQLRKFHDKTPEVIKVELERIFGSLPKSVDDVGADEEDQW